MHDGLLKIPPKIVVALPRANWDFYKKENAAAQTNPSLTHNTQTKTTHHKTTYTHDTCRMTQRLVDEYR